MPREQTFFFRDPAFALRARPPLRRTLVFFCARAPPPLCACAFLLRAARPPRRPCARAAERANAVGSSALARAVAEILPFPSPGRPCALACAAGRPRVRTRLPFSLPPFPSLLLLVSSPFRLRLLPHFLLFISRSFAAFSRRTAAAMSRLPAVVIDNGTGYARHAPPRGARRENAAMARARRRTLCARRRTLGKLASALD